MSTLKVLIDETTNIKNDLITCHTNLKNILIAKGADITHNSNIGNLINDINQLGDIEPIDRNIYSIIVDENNANPDTMITYADASIGIETATRTDYGGWKNIFPFNKIKPCSFQNGNVFSYIDVNNFKKHIDGSDVNHELDVMIEIPKFYIKVETRETGYKISISQTKVDESWTCPFHTVGVTEKDNIYIGAYTNGSRNSLSSKCVSNVTTDTGMSSISICQGWQSKMPIGYSAIMYSSLNMLHLLYMFMYKSNNIKNLGVGLSIVSNSMVIGSCVTKGMIFGQSEQSKTIGVKFLGIEDLWGGSRKFIEGVWIDSNNNLWIGDNKFTNMKHELIGKYNEIWVSSSGYTSKILANAKYLFLPKEVKGSNTTYYSAYISVAAINKLRTYINSATMIGGAFLSKSDENTANTVTRVAYYGTDNGLPYN